MNITQKELHIVTAIPALLVFHYIWYLTSVPVLYIIQSFTSNIRSLSLSHLLLLHFLFHSHYYSEQSTLPVLSVVWLKSVLISSLVDLGRNLAYRILGMLMFCPVFLGFRGKIVWMSHKVMLFDDSLYDKYVYRIYHTRMLSYFRALLGNDAPLILKWQKNIYITTHLAVRSTNKYICFYLCTKNSSLPTSLNSILVSIWLSKFYAIFTNPNQFLLDRGIGHRVSGSWHRL
jgi:hypothetical protein